MATKKRKRKPISLQFKFKDERVTKLIGLISVIASTYLFIAFTSYLYTWQDDFNYVNRFDWGILFEFNIEIHNWLGRLGAMVSHQFFYWWVGLPSFIFVMLLFRTGMNLILERPLAALNSWYKFGFIAIFWLSIFLAFVSGDTQFAWGGAFGNGITTWLQSVVGVFGTFIVIFGSVIGLIIWFVNPNFNEWTVDRALYEFKIFLEKWIPKQYHNFFKFIKTNYTPPATAQPLKAKKPKTQHETLQPDSLSKEELAEMEDMETILQSEENDSIQLLEQGEIEFMDINKNPKPTAKTSLGMGGDDDLEIVIPTADKKESVEFNDYKNEPLDIQEGNEKHFEPYDPTLDLASYENPVLQLLVEYDENLEIDRAELENNKDQIIKTLLDYKIEIIKIKATIGPTVTLYEIIPAPGVRVSKIKNLEDDIALSLAALGIRIIAPIPGKGTIGIEVPNKKTRIVGLKEVLASEKFKRAKMDLPIALGRTIDNEVFVADLAKMPHLLIAGATGQGKSVGINTVLMSLLYKKHPSQLKLILIDPKKVELSLYTKLENHFLGYVPEFEPIVTEMTEVTATLNSLCIEMDTRYDLLKRAHVRNIKEYNQKFTQRRLNPEKGHRFLPYIVLVIDEFADLIMTAGKEIELPIGRLAQLARAIGIHLIIATQRPSVNIITGVIKANFPARMAFKVSSKIDSRTILDTGGAEQLIGKGDMLLSYNGNMLRIQCAFVDTPEVDRVIDFIHKQRGYPEPFFLPEFSADGESSAAGTVNYKDFDENFEDAARLVVRNQQGSTSMIQRKMKLGYNRAGRIMDQMESVGIVGPNEGSKAREVLIYDEQELDRFIAQLKNM
jgi:S-DNA-T family DNA segregation ATPase FtsK/SpoIIIE